MKKKVMISALILLAVSVIVFALTYHANRNRTVPQDYFAVFSDGVPDYCFYSIYLYLDDETQARYIATFTPTTFAGESGNTKIVQEGKLKYPQDVFNLEINYENVVITASGSSTLNKDIPETSQHKAYKKGDSLTSEELYELISVK